MISIPSLVGAPTGASLAVAPNLARAGVAAGGSGGVAPTPNPALALASMPQSITIGAPPGTLVATIANVPAGVMPSVTPNDGRLFIAGDASAGWRVVLGMSAISEGSIGFTVSAIGASSTSATLQIAAAGAPDAPALTLGGSDGRVAVGWVDGSGNGSAITGHKIYSGTSATALTLLAQVTTASPYADLTVTNGVERFYAVSALNSAGREGPRSEVKSVTPSAGIARFTNPVVGVLAGSSGRQIANNPKSGDDVTSKGGGLISYVSFQEPRMGTILFQAPSDAWQNSAGMGGTIYADDGDGFTTYASRMPRILTSNCNIVVMDLTRNSIQNETTVLAYTNSAKIFATRLRDAGKVVIILSCIMRNSAAGGAWGLNSAGRALVRPINAEMQSWAAGQQNMEYVDGFSEFCDPNNDYEPYPWAVRDGTHYTPMATWLWAKKINAVTAKYLVASGPYNPVITNLHPNPTLSGDVAIPASTSTTNITGTLPTGLTVTWDAGQTVASTKDSKVTIARVPGTNRWRITVDRSAMVSNVEGFYISLSAPPSFAQGKSYQAFLDVNFEPTTDSGWANIGSLSIRHSGETATGLVPMTSSETPLGDFDGGGGMPMPTERIKGRMWSPELRCIAAGTFATVYRNNFWWRKGDQTPLQCEFENPILAEVKDGRQVYFNVAVTDAPVFTSPATISFPEESTFSHQFSSNRTGVYSIAGGDSALFTVVRNTGLLTAVSGVLDYDQDRSPTYTMTVTFTPYDYRQSAITQAFTINVTDIDDGFTDQFTGTAGPLDQRPNWTLAGGQSGALVTSGTTVSPDTAKGVGACLAPQIGDSPDQEVRFTLSSNSSGPTACLKLIDEQNYIGIRCSNSTLRLVCAVAGAATFQTVLATNFNPNSASQIIAQQMGTILRVYQSDALIYTVDMTTLTTAQIPDVLRNCKRSGIMSTATGGNVRIDAWNNRLSLRRADKIYLKTLSVTATGVAGTDYASDIANYSPTATRSMGTITGPNNDVIVDGLTLRVQKPVAGTTTVQIIEDDATAANTPKTTTVTITFS
jgi:hypothetical protein